ncbi:hypothetical protein [Olivibacter sp. LS-1]|uniref:hypothetical protein n=1 Tax=Olivibacter sp. LS-1 TaxID=2592345 RepID=UPI00143CF766|nr:hypothetical protein [Olivibacter sp. LS-1]
MGDTDRREQQSARLYQCKYSYRLGEFRCAGGELLRLLRQYTGLSVQPGQTLAVLGKDPGAIGSKKDQSDGLEQRLPLDGVLL